MAAEGRVMEGVVWGLSYDVITYPACVRLRVK